MAPPDTRATVSEVQNGDTQVNAVVAGADQDGAAQVPPAESGALPRVDSRRRNYNRRLQATALFFGGFVMFDIMGLTFGAITCKQFMDQEKSVHARDPEARIVHRDFYMAVISNFVACCLLGYLGLWMFHYFSQCARPARRGTPLKRLMASLFGAALCLICALWTTWATVVVATGKGRVEGVSESRVNEIFADRDGREFGAQVLRYKDNEAAVMAIVFEWVAWASLFGRYIILLFTIHYGRYDHRLQGG